MTASEQKTAQLKPKGECGIYEISDLCKTLSELLRKAPSVTLDLSSVDRVDASFLQLLVAMQAEADRTETRLTLKNPSENVTDLIAALHFDLSTELLYFSLQRVHLIDHAGHRFELTL